MTAAFAQKLGMTHIYDDKNRHVAVTILKVTPQVISDLKTKAKDGYTAVQIGTEGKKHIAKPQQGDLTKHAIDLRIAHRKEVRIESDDDTQVSIGQAIVASDFVAGDMVTVTGTSKGKGFSGTIKRHNFSRGPETHVQLVRATHSAWLKVCAWLVTWVIASSQRKVTKSWPLTPTTTR
jgi:large subunit ribosomal protein L3